MADFAVEGLEFGSGGRERKQLIFDLLWGDVRGEAGGREGSAVAEDVGGGAGVDEGAGGWG